MSYITINPYTVMTDKQRDKLIYDILFSDTESFEVDLSGLPNEGRLEFRNFIKSVISRSSSSIYSDSVSMTTTGPVWKFFIKRRVSDI